MLVKYRLVTWSSCLRVDALWHKWTWEFRVILMERTRTAAPPVIAGHHCYVVQHMLDLDPLRVCYLYEQSPHIRNDFRWIHHKVNTEQDALTPVSSIYSSQHHTELRGDLLAWATTQLGEKPPNRQNLHSLLTTNWRAELRSFYSKMRTSCITFVWVLAGWCCDRWPSRVLPRDLRSWWLCGTRTQEGNHLFCLRTSCHWSIVDEYRLPWSCTSQSRDTPIWKQIVYISMSTGDVLPSSTTKVSRKRKRRDEQ